VVPHYTVKERKAFGKAARARISREAHGAWNPAPNRPDPLALLESQAVTRIPELIPIRYGRMLVSPFAFYRGTAIIMASDLATMPHTGLQVQLCGDAHLSNFGGFASPERELIVSLNDFDETLPGPWEWDVKRLAASMEIAGRARGFDEKTRHKIVHDTVNAYCQAMHEFAELDNLSMWYLHLTTAEIHARWGFDAMKEFSGAQKRDNVRAMKKLTHYVDGELRIAPHPPLIVPIEDLISGEELAHQHEKMSELIRLYRATLQPDRRHLLENYEYAHVARKVVGVGSVGTRTWVLLLLGRDEKDPLFLQVKEAEASVLEPYLGKSEFANHGQRVVAGQWLMQATSDIFLGWEHVDSGLKGEPHDFYVRQLWDWKVSADIDSMSVAELLVYGEMCGWTLARAHGRSGDRVAISSYLGSNNTFAKSLVTFSAAYADQNERDFKTVEAAAKAGRIKVETGI
jgi:uncharacterized protein (DUF2252 family)